MPWDGPDVWRDEDGPKGDGMAAFNQVERYLIRIMGREDIEDDSEVFEILLEVVQEAESMISDALPEGYYAKIEEW